MNNKELIIGKLYKTPWKCTAWEGSVITGHSDFNKKIQIADGDCVVVLAVIERPREVILEYGTFWTMDFKIGIMTSCGNLAVVDATSAGLEFWAKGRLA
jgi:hypothetical protein